MGKAEFDEFSESYESLLKESITIGGEEADYYLRYKIRDVAKHYPFQDHNNDTQLEVLDFGAGTGNALPYWHELLPQAQMTCVDVSSQSLDVAAKRHAGLATFIAYTPPSLPLDDNQFDLIYAACVFHHIMPEDRSAVLRELQRVLKPGGRLLIYEHNPINPLTQQVVRSCPFDKNAVLIHAKELRQLLTNEGFIATKIRYRVFFPSLFRWLRPLEDLLTWLPLGAQYYTTSLKDSASKSSAIGQ